ncbi:MAG: hypothetical protein ACC612_08960 [Methanomethylovorans sp.]|uniref:hypothetical protein n=1 Tax=Methanomethylovorans sp. TaxID=2758717 RepID=UPI0035307BF7
MAPFILLIFGFFRVVISGEPLGWVQRLQLKDIETPVQLSDLLTQAEFERLMGPVDILGKRH